MKDSDTLKKIVKEKYAEIAVAPKKSCGCCGDEAINYSVLSKDYTNLEGYVADADLKLGCGIPTEYAGINEGNRVLDLGSGAGNDVFVARRIVGEKGSVTGLDFTEEMLEKARKNNDTMGYQNVDFVKGDIEDIPLPENSFDVVISNCVLNLVPDKVKAFREIHRVLHSGGHFCVSDIVLEGALPDEMRKAAELYAGCVSGALQKDDYLAIITEAGFSNIEVKSYVSNDVPDEYLLESVSQETLDAYKKTGAGIFSITVKGVK
jgi:ubiquinone/menaquinone biosynthesis C-methylase UbiE